MPQTETTLLDALIVAHGQPGDPEPAEAALTEIATRVGTHLPQGRVGSATMAAPGRLEAALETLPDGGVIYPLFMADGWFVKTALRDRIKHRDLRVLTPLGLDPHLPDVAVRGLRHCMAEQGWSLAKTTVCVAAHGSARSPFAGASAEAFVSHLRAALPDTTFTTTFVEQAPFLDALAPDLPAQTVCLPFFAMAGEHLRVDVSETLRAAGFTGPILPAFGQTPDVAALIARALITQVEGRGR